MADSKNKFYVTTPIYYVTAKPHLGSLYSTLLADIAARWNKLKGKKTFFLTGTDEHGQKIADAAKKVGLPPKEFIDGFIDSYKNLWHSYQLDYNYFIRTTENFHAKAVQHWIEYVQKKGDIYKSVYSGWYCVSDETYLPETDLQNPPCPSCGRTSIFVSESSYFFKLSKYQDALLEFYESNPDFITPAERLNEVISFVKSGLKDLAISRTTVKWGIPFPGDPEHVVYVWADALNNYISAVGYGQPQKKAEFDFWWPADLQILGKDIVRFHAVFWPAFLMAADLEMPKRLLVHGWIKVNQEKMSKSLGNVIDPNDLLKHYGNEPVRYYLARHMSIAQDSEFSIHDLEEKINADLVNDLGNLLNRAITLSLKNDLQDLAAPAKWSPDALELKKQFLQMLELFISDMDNCFYNRALSHLWRFINLANSYFQHQEPWKNSIDKEKFNEIIAATCNALYISAILLEPIMPSKMVELLDALGTKIDKNIDQLAALQNYNWDQKFKLKKIEPLFTKIEIKKMEEPKIEKADMTDTKFINIEQFLNVELVAGTIAECSEIPESEKLLKLNVDFGPLGQRIILSGIKKFYKPDELVGKQAVFVFNLAPRKMINYESHGMLLTAADQNGKPEIIMPANPVINGTKLK